MAIKRTTWHPDTCGCVIEYEWDEAAPHQSRVHTGVRAVPCALHAHLGNAHAIYQAVVTHNLQNQTKG